MAGFSGGARRHGAVFAAGFLTFLNMWCTQALLPVLAAYFNVPEAATGWTVTAPLVATAMVAPLVGAISDRFGRKILICGAGFLVLLPSLAAAQATHLHALIAYRFIQGLLLPFIFTVTVAYIGGEARGADAVKLAGTYTSGGIFGGFMGRLVSGVVTGWLGWRAAFLAVALISLLAALLILRTLPGEKNFHPVHGMGAALRAFAHHLRNRRLLGTYAVGFGVLFSLVAVFTFINFRLAAAPYGLGPAALGMIFIVYLAGMVVSPLAARLSIRFGRRAVMGGAGAMIAIGLGLTLATPLWAITLGLMLVSSGIFVQQTLATAYVGIVALDAKSAAVGLYVTSYYVGGSAGGIVPASIWHLFQWPGCVAIVWAVQAAMFFTMRRTWRETGFSGAKIRARS